MSRASRRHPAPGGSVATHAPAQAPPATQAPPECRAAEESVVGAAITTRGMLAKLRQVVEPGDFHHQVLRVIMTAACELDDAGKPADLLTVARRMDETGTFAYLKAHGGNDFLVALLHKGKVGDIEHHARMVRRLSLRRRRSEVGHQIGLLALGGADTAAHQAELARLDRAEQELDLPAGGLAVSPADAIRADWGKPLPPAVSTGIPDLDQALGGGLRYESAAVLNGATGRGKSGLAIQIGRHIARGGSPVLYLTSELSRRQVLSRVLAHELRETWASIFDLGPSEVERLAAAMAPIDRLTVMEVKASILEAVDAYQAATGTTPIVIVDYLQHIARRNLKLDPRMAVAAVSQEVTDLARERRTIVLCISSVSRAVATSDKANKAAEDFVTAGAESGAIEFDARAVMMLDADSCPPGGTAEARLHLSKSTFSGGNLTIGLRFHGALGLFEPDSAAALSPDLRAVMEAITKTLDDGATTVEKVRKYLGEGKTKVVPKVEALHRKGLVKRSWKGIELL